MTNGEPLENMLEISEIKNALLKFLNDRLQMYLSKSGLVKEFKYILTSPEVDMQYGNIS